MLQYGPRRETTVERAPVRRWDVCWAEIRQSDRAKARNQVSAHHARVHLERRLGDPVLRVITKPTLRSR